MSSEIEPGAHAYDNTEEVFKGINFLGSDKEARKRLAVRIQELTSEYDLTKKEQDILTQRARSSLQPIKVYDTNPLKPHLISDAALKMSALVTGEDSSHYYSYVPDEDLRSTINALPGVAKEIVKERKKEKNKTPTTDDGALMIQGPMARLDEME